MRILLIYQSIPESISFYQFVDPSPEELTKLRGCHNLIINASDEDNFPKNSIDFIIEISEGKHDDNMIYSSEEKGKGKPIIIDDSVEIIVSGFAL